jgi:RNA polymerase sigma factor (sigma-70 family)
MFAGDFSMRTFWFGNEELLTKILAAEIEAVMQLFASYPDLRKLYDSPEATRPQRTACFTLLARRKIMEMVYETFAGRYEQSPSLGDTESDALSRTHNLVTADAPAWVLEVNEVAERLPSHIYDALPEPLRVGGYDANNPEQVESVKSAARALSSVEQIRALTEGVIDQQLGRLERRWSATNPVIMQHDQAQPDQSSVTKAYPLNPFEGLVQKNDLSRYSQYMDTLTEKQRTAFLLKFEYGLGLSQIALRMGIDRKTADEHIKAAQRKVEQAGSAEKRKARRAKNTPEF